MNSLDEFIAALVKISYLPSCRPTLTHLHVSLSFSLCALSSLQLTVLFHSLNDSTQSANRIAPGATLSALNRYTQKHLSVCPWKWGCLCARECLCIAQSSWISGKRNIASCMSLLFVVFHPWGVERNKTERRHKQVLSKGPSTVKRAVHTLA